MRRFTVYITTADGPDLPRRAVVRGEGTSGGVSYRFSYRVKKPGENVQSATTVGVWTTNPLGVPGGSRALMTTSLVTVDAIDEANGTVTVKAKDGTSETVKARNPRNLKLLKVGDELVVSLYRAVAISLRRETAGGAS